MINRNAWLHDFGRRVYGLAGIALGTIGLVWQDFAAVWQPIDNLGVGAHRKSVACVFAACLLAAGAATLWRGSARIGLPTLTVLHLVSAVAWLPRIVGNPNIYGVWNGLFEQVSLVAAGAVGYASLAPLANTQAMRTIRIGQIVFGVCAVSFALGHFTAIPEAASMVPKWLPLGQPFWAWTTGAFHLLAGVAILTGIQAALAARLLTAMMIGFGALVWIPLLVATPRHFTWAGNAINLALLASAWVVADSLAERR